MNVDALLFQAEDEILKNEVSNFHDLESLKKWTEFTGCCNHPVVLRKVKELQENADIRSLDENNDELLECVSEYETRQLANKFRCNKCAKVFKRKNELLTHTRSTHENITYACCRCGKLFAYKTNKTRHEKKCILSNTMTDNSNKEQLRTNDTRREEPKDKGKGIKCKTLGLILRGKKQINNHRHPPSKTSTQALDRHPGPSSALDTQASSEKKPTRAFRCRICKKIFKNRRELYIHRNLDHQEGQGEHTQSLPWNNENSPYSDDEKFKQVYQANKKFILEENKDGDVQATFNFPLNNYIDPNTMMKAIENIAIQQTNSFKIQISFGLILRHVETEDLRYFIPDRNDSLFDRPFLISSMSDLHKLRRKLETVELTDFLLRSRKDTKWKLFFLSDMKIFLFKTSFLLGAGKTQLPDFIEKNQNICALTKNRKGKFYTDNLCMFRCLALHMGRRDSLEETTKSNFNKYMHYIGSTDTSIKTYPGVPLADVHHIEECFNINVNIFELREDGSVIPTRKSLMHYPETMNVNIYDEHLSFISNMKSYSKKYQCLSCDRCFPSSWRCLQHSRRCELKTKFVYPGGFHYHHPSIFERLDEYGIHTDENLRHFPFFIVYDFEAMLCPTDTSQLGKLKWEAEHQPISVSVCSNVEIFREPRCFIDSDCESLVDEMFTYMTEITEVAIEMTSERWEEVFLDLRDHIKTWEEEEDAHGREAMVSALKTLEGSFKFYCQQIPVLGFNSSSYDLNLVKQHIASQLRLFENNGITVKRDNSYTCISNEELKFLDVANYLAAGTSYSGFLKSYGIQENKGFFPYEYLTHPDRLKETELPPHEAFYSSLKECNISEEEYKYCQQIWIEHSMETLQDFLVWYNNLDVLPFVNAVEKMQEFYFQRNIDVFKVAMTVPGIARQMLFQASKGSGASFSLFGDRDKDLFKIVKDNIVGGPSIFFTRHAKQGRTYIRNNREKICRRILGFDANALYLWALGQALPTGTYVRRFAETGFIPEARDQYASAYHWMNWLTETTEYSIRHKFNYGREKRIGPFPVDGFCQESSTVFQFHGCYFHGHDCTITRSINDKAWRDNRSSKYEKTIRTSDFIKERGYTLVEIWECEYRSLRKRTPTLRDLINKMSPSFFRRFKGKTSETQILNAVRDDRLFGMIEVDIQVPKQWPSHFVARLPPYKYFEEMAPLFCTTDIPFEVIGDHMKEYVRKNGLSEKPRRLLVGGMKARKLLLASPLLQWYLRHGMEVTRIYQVIEYTPSRCFQSFVNTVTEARRHGDACPDMKVIADTMKTIGNSAFGGLNMDKTKHTNIKYVQGKRSAQDAINETGFMGLTQLNGDVYEVEKSKSTIRLDLPIQLGYFVLQYGKLRMLEFYYDFMDKFCDRSDFVYCEMDTDSAYMAISGKDLLSIIKPDMREQYINGLHGFCQQQNVVADNDNHWFPRECCTEHTKRDTRTPGLLKLE